MRNYITKYEKTSLIGARATMLSEGAPPMIDLKNLTDPIEIAEEEFRQRKIPLLIERKMHNGTIVKLSIKNMECPRG